MKLSVVHLVILAAVVVSPGQAGRRRRSPGPRNVVAVYHKRQKVLYVNCTYKHLDTYRNEPLHAGLYGKTDSHHDVVLLYAHLCRTRWHGVFTCKNYYHCGGIQYKARWASRDKHLIMNYEFKTDKLYWEKLFRCGAKKLTYPHKWRELMYWVNVRFVN